MDMDVAFDSDANEYDWPKTGSLSNNLMQLEKSLTCLICKDFLKNPQSLPCDHTYCSECLITALDMKINPNATREECPTCKVKCTLQSARPNRPLAAVVMHFQQSRVDLLTMLTTPATTTSNAIAAMTTLEQNLIHSKNGKAITKRIVPWIFQSSDGPAKIKKKLEEESRGSRIPLSTTGTRDQLERRYRDFVNMHNAQVGSINAMSLDDVIREVSKREAAREREKARTGSSSIPTEKLEPKFKEMIQRMKDERGKENQREGNDNGGDVANTVSKAANGASEVTMGDWRVVYSEKCQRPFYYNVHTEIGQWDVPEEWRLNVNESEEEEEQEEIEVEVKPKSRKRGRPARGESQHVTNDTSASSKSQRRPQRCKKASSQFSSPEPTPSMDGAISSTKTESIHYLSSTNSNEKKSHTGSSSLGNMYLSAIPIDIDDSDFDQTQQYNPNPNPSHSIRPLKISQTQVPTPTQPIELSNSTQDAIWPCPICTFNNIPSAANCAVCDSANPFPSRRSNRRDAFSAISEGRQSLGSKSGAKRTGPSQPSGKLHNKRKR